MGEVSQSEQWAWINSKYYSEISSEDLESFKSSSLNHKIVLWNPATNGVRYLKELIFFAAKQITDEEWAILDNIRNREVGDPIAVTVKGRSVCVDYLHALFEVSFIRSHCRLENGSVLEIGAGYGRTCHALLSNFDLSQYTIVDLPQMLGLAARYLEMVLPPEDFKKIRFLSVDDFPAALDQQYDLSLNIDSFAEMDESVVREYLAFIRERCSAFYVKNPVGKYLDKSLDDHSEGEEIVKMALSSGILKDIIDIYDDKAVAEQAQKFTEAYRPGDEWDLVADGSARLWSSVWQAVYTKR